MNTCKTCKHWEQVIIDSPIAWLQRRSSGGYCKNSKLCEDWDDAYQPDQLVYSYMENGTFWTGPNFGCVHHSIRSTMSALDKDPH